MNRSALRYPLIASSLVALALASGCSKKEEAPLPAAPKRSAVVTLEDGSQVLAPSKARAEAQFRSRYAALDADGDGKVTQKEFSQSLLAAFDELDTEGKGLTSQQVRAAVNRPERPDLRGGPRTPQVVRAQMARKGARQALAELMSRVAPPGQAIQREEFANALERQFRVLDFDGNGKLEPADVLAQMRQTVSAGAPGATRP